MTSIHVASMGPPPLPSSINTSNLPNRRNSKRLSLQFQFPSTDQMRPRPSSTTSTSPVTGRSIDLSQDSVKEAKPANFLTMLAAQERRVMELKEELSKAEVELSRLKTKWAVHEATKKRNETRKLESLHEPASLLPNRSEPLALQRSRTSLEDDKRRSANSRAKNSQMKVFPGGRHTRALSLLTPLRSAACSDYVPFPNESKAPALSLVNSTVNNLPKTSGESRKGHVQDLYPSRDVMHTGKEIVSGIREGLWTFIEDLKQATVGDEAMTGARAKQASLVNRPSDQQRQYIPAECVTSSIQDIKDNATTKDPWQYTSTSSEGNYKTKLLRNRESKDPMIDEEYDDGWDNWDSPLPKTPRFSFSNTETSSPRTSVSSHTSKDQPDDKQIDLKPLKSSEQTPWPALSKLRPGTLTKSANQFMAEWEKSPENRGIIDPSHLASANKNSKTD